MLPLLLFVFQIAQEWNNTNVWAANLWLSGEKTLLVVVMMIRVIMTVKTTRGFERYSEGGGGGGGGVGGGVLSGEQQGFHLFVQAEPLRLSSISSLRGSNQMDALITLCRFWGS